MSNLLAVQRTLSAAVYQPSQLNEGKINVQYRMPTNKLVAVDPMLDITAGSFTSTATGKNVSLKWHTQNITITDTMFSLSVWPLQLLWLYVSGIDGFYHCRWFLFLYCSQTAYTHSPKRCPHIIFRKRSLWVWAVQYGTSPLHAYCHVAGGARSIWTSFRRQRYTCSF